MKKVVRIVILSVFAFCLSIACKNYTEDIEDYLSYWSAGVSITEYRFEPQPQIYTEGMQCVSSKAPVTVTFTVHNSKNLNLKMPGDSDAPADIISFPHIPDAPDKRVAAPQSGNDYEFKKISNTELKLTYNPAFLQKYEWGRGDITPSIILYTTDGRVFKQNIPFKLNVNTPPPAIAECVIGQTETASPSKTCYYVLRLQLSDDDMKKTCGNGLLHGDIAGIEINGTIYRLSVAGPQKQLNVQGQGDSPFIGKAKVKKLTTTDAKEIPSDWTLYFKTDAPVGSPKTDAYTVRLKDAKGLYSEPVTVGTQGKIVTLTFNLAGGNISGSAAAITRTGAPGASFSAPVPTRQGYTFTGWLPALLPSPTFPAANTTYTAQWTLNTYTVTFKVDGGQGSLTGTHNSTSKVASGSTEMKFESVPHNSTITFTATPSGGWEVEKWMLDGNEVPGHTNTSYTLSNVTGNKTVKVKFKAVGGQGPTIEATSWEELRAKVQSATEGTIIEIAQNLTYNISDAAGNESIIKVTKDITIKSTASHTYTLDAGGRGADNTASNAKSTGIFEVDDGKTLTLENLILTKTEKYAVYVAENSSLTMKNVTINNCKTQYNVAGIYFNKGKDLKLENCEINLCKGKGSASSGGIYIQEPKGTVSIKDTIIKNCKTKENGSGTGGGIYLYKAAGTLENVKVDSCSAKSGGGIYVKGGTLTITGGSFINNSTGGTGQSDGGGAIYNEGAKVTIIGCTIGDDDSRKGNLAVQGGGIFVDGGAECILEAGTKIIGNGTIGLGTGTGNGGGVYVAGNSSLKMENVTIKNCEATGTDSAGGGVYLYKGTCTLEKVIVEGCKAPKGGGIFVSEEAECILKQDVKILQNVAMGTNSNGGGIFVDKDSGDIKLGTLTINGSSEKPVIISKNTADYGGGVYNRGTAAINHAEIKDNNVQYHGGGMVNAGTCTMDSVRIENNEASNQNSNVGNGGGIYSDKKLTLKDTTVIGNTAKRDGGAIYIDDSVFNMSGSTVINVEPSGGATGPSKNDIYLTNTAFITLTGALTATENIARITLNSLGGYKNNREIVKGDSGFTIPSGYENKFTITDKIGSQPHWKLISQNHVLKLRLK